MANVRKDVNDIVKGDKMQMNPGEWVEVYHTPELNSDGTVTLYIRGDDYKQSVIRLPGDWKGLVQEAPDPYIPVMSYPVNTHAGDSPDKVLGKARLYPDKRKITVHYLEGSDFEKFLNSGRLRALYLSGIVIPE